VLSELPEKGVVLRGQKGGIVALRAVQSVLATLDNVQLLCMFKKVEHHQILNKLTVRGVRGRTEEEEF
jgi:hypothetical protein